MSPSAGESSTEITGDSPTNPLEDLTNALKDGLNLKKQSKDEELLEYLANPTHDEAKAKNLDPKTCHATDYVINFIFPSLLPAINEMLSAAKDNLVFENWRAMKRFNACDFITEYLYNENLMHPDREKTALWDIPFVQKINERNPRPPLPFHLLWTEEEAAVVIQSYWRGYLVRRTDEVQELRQYQRDMRESSYHIMFRVEDFWKKHPVEDLDDNEVVADGENETVETAMK